MLVLVSIVASGLTNSPLPIYRSTADVDRAAEWLDQHAHPGEVILANWELSNYLGPRTPARVVGGHPVATLDAGTKQAHIAAAFGGSGDLLALARQQAADWIVESPADTPAIALPADELMFTSGKVHVYHVASDRQTGVADDSYVLRACPCHALVESSSPQDAAECSQLVLLQESLCRAFVRAAHDRAG
jgi:hypothetical protein